MVTIKDARWLKHRQSVELWKVRNRGYYLGQKRRLAHRPEYLAHRREMYRAARPSAQTFHLSTTQNILDLQNDASEANEAGAGRSHRSWGDAEGAPIRARANIAVRQAEKSAGESGGRDQCSR